MKKQIVQPYEKRIEWLHKARFGLFVHFGPYSQLGHGEWAMWSERIPAAEYAEMADNFNPKNFDADAWAENAVKAGMKYAVFTTRHHDGYCLFDSSVSDFSSVKKAPKRDFTAEFVKAFRKAGLKVGLYYSLVDWRFPGAFEPGKHPESAKRMVEQAHSQVVEIMSNYGKIDVLWYDGCGIDLDKAGVKSVAEFWRSEELNAKVRNLQPNILINNRAGVNEDLDTPEQQVKACAPGRGWETCMTINVWGGWSYIPGHATRRTAPQLIQHLVETAAGEGNFLLNIGPRGDGSFANEDTKILEAIGEWLKTNGEAIYGSQGCALIGGRTAWIGDVPFNSLGRWTRKGKTAYLHCLVWHDKCLSIPLVKTRVKSVSLLASDAKLSFEQRSNGRLLISGLPSKPPQAVNVVKVVFTDVPESLDEPEKAAWIEGRI